MVVTMRYLDILFLATFILQLHEASASKNHLEGSENSFDQSHKQSRHPKTNETETATLFKVFLSKLERKDNIKTSKPPFNHLFIHLEEDRSHYQELIEIPSFLEPISFYFNNIEKDLRKYIHFLEKCSNLGDNKSTYELAQIYDHDRGGTPDALNKAFSLYLKLANNLDPIAFHRLRILYSDLSITEENKSHFISQTKTLAKEGHLTAQLALARHFMSISHDPAELEHAFMIFLKCAEVYPKKVQKGIANFYMSELGLCYLQGKGTDRDLKKAVECFKNGAQLDDPPSMVELGKMYLTGVGVEQNEEEGVRLLQTSDLLSGLLELAAYYLKVGNKKDYQSTLNHIIRVKKEDHDSRNEVHKKQNLFMKVLSTSVEKEIQEIVRRDSICDASKSENLPEASKAPKKKSKKNKKKPNKSMPHTPTKDKEDVSKEEINTASHTPPSFASERKEELAQDKSLSQKVNKDKKLKKESKKEKKRIKKALERTERLNKYAEQQLVKRPEFNIGSFANTHFSSSSFQKSIGREVKKSHPFGGFVVDAVEFGQKVKQFFSSGHSSQDALEMKKSNKKRLFKIYANDTAGIKFKDLQKLLTDPIFEGKIEVKEMNGKLHITYNKGTDSITITDHAPHANEKKGYNQNTFKRLIQDVLVEFKLPEN